MILNFKELNIEGFMSFDKESVLLDNLGMTYIKGVNNYEPLSVSNGSGKSAIFESIIWCLTGYTSRGASDVSNSILGKGVKVTLVFTKDIDTYKITRSKNHYIDGTKLEIIKNGNNISGNTFTKSKQILSDELGAICNYDILTSIIIMSQGLPNRLSMLKPSSRKSRLEELSNSEEFISKLQDKVSRLTVDFQSTMTEINNKVISLDTTINSSNTSIQDKLLKIDELSNSSTMTKEEYESINSKLSLINSKIKDTQSALTKATNLYSKELSTYQNIMYKIEGKKSEINTLLSKYKSVSNNICPTCGQHIANQDTLDTLLESTNKSVMDCKVEISNLSVDAENAESSSSMLKSKIDQLTELISSLSSNKDKLYELINSYDITNTSIDVIKSDIDNLKKLVEDCKVKLTKLTDDLNKYKELVNISVYLKSQLSRNFRTYVLSGIVTYINDRCKEYSPYLFKEQGNVSLSINKNNLDIYLGDRSFENLSGGEGRRVDLILQLAQRDLARSESGFLSNLLVMDEVLDNLDSKGIESVLSLLSYKSPDIDTLMIVSHQSDLLIPKDTTLTVSKGADQISHIKYEYE